MRLNIKYSQPVDIDRCTEIEVAIKEKRMHVIALDASITQEGRKRVTALAQFFGETK